MTIDNPTLELVNLCPQKHICGSCGWSHIPYAKQLLQKVQDINYSFKLHQLPFRCTQITPSPKTNHYRNRMDFIINFEGKVGLREKGKWWKVIDNHPCFIAKIEIEKYFYQIRDWVQTTFLSYYDRKKLCGLLRYAVIRVMNTNESMITIVTSKPNDSKEEQSIRSELNRLSDLIETTTLVWAINDTNSDISHGGQNLTINGPGSIHEIINGNRYIVRPNSFFQTNSYTSPQLMDAVIQSCGDIKNKTVLDLYCGSGFFSVALAKHSDRIFGIESIMDAIDDANQNNKLNHTAVKFTHAESENLSWLSLSPQIVIIDPPRKGLNPKVTDALLTLKPEKIIYVSCNYKKFAEDAQRLLREYRVVKTSAIDMFPHTPHVELITEFTAKGNV